MQDIPELIDQLFRERVLRARAQSVESKLQDGPELFEYACRISLDGIRSQHPEADGLQVISLLHERLEIGRRLEVWQ